MEAKSGTRDHACVLLVNFIEMASDPAVRKLTLEEVKTHNSAGSSWLVIHNQVFDVTKFLDEVSDRIFEENGAKEVLH